MLLISNACPVMIDKRDSIFENMAFSHFCFSKQSILSENDRMHLGVEFTLVTRWAGELHSGLIQGHRNEFNIGGDT